MGISSNQIDKVWAVIGRKPEESGDPSVWIVAIYPEPEMADQHCQLAQKWWADNHLRGSFVGSLQSPYDPRITSFTDSPDYYISDSPVPFVLHVDQFLERFPT